MKNNDLRSSCILHSGAVGTSGYGNRWNKLTRKVEGAHRIAWQKTNGEIPDGLWVLHKCDVKLCINPDHLFLGTASDNTLDMLAKGRRPYLNPNPFPSGEKNLQSKIPDDELNMVKELLVDKSIRHQDVADIYGVHLNTVGRWIRR